MPDARLGYDLCGSDVVAGAEEECMFSPGRFFRTLPEEKDRGEILGGVNGYGLVGI